MCPSRAPASIWPWPWACSSPTGSSKRRRSPTSECWGSWASTGRCGPCRGRCPWSTPWTTRRSWLPPATARWPNWWLPNGSDPSTTSRRCSKRWPARSPGPFRPSLEARLAPSLSPTSATSRASRWPAGPWRWPRPVGTTCCWSGPPARARPCWPAAWSACCLTCRTRSPWRSPGSTRRPGWPFPTA